MSLGLRRVGKKNVFTNYRKIDVNYTFGKINIFCCMVLEVKSMMSL
jgi:hypothetical protein